MLTHQGVEPRRPMTCLKGWIQPLLLLVFRKGLTQIQDLMAQNKSRLGDIYSERSWTERLSKENKDRILQMIDEKYREQVGQQLYPPSISIKTKPKTKINLSTWEDSKLKAAEKLEDWFAGHDVNFGDD